MFAKAVATSQQQVGILHVTGLFYQREEDFIADHLEKIGGLIDFEVKEILSTTSWVKYGCFRYSRLRSVFTSYFLLLASFIAAIKRTSQSGWPHMCANLWLIRYSYICG